MQNNCNALKNFANPCKVGHFIGGKFGFRQVNKRHDLNYDNSVKITLFFFSFQASLITKIQFTVPNKKSPNFGPPSTLSRGKRITTI